MSLSSYFAEHEEQAFVAKVLCTAIAIIFVKDFLGCLLTPLMLIFPVVFLIGIRMHAAATGVDAMDLLREHITFLPMMRSEADRRREVKPWVTYGIILLNVLIFYGFEMRVPEEALRNLVFLPHDPDLFNVPISALSSIFLHGSNGHLWGNMTFLWVVGTAVERRVGRVRFLWLYLLTGLIGGLVFVLVEYLFHGAAGHALGASGAIAGIMGIFAVRCYFKSMIFPVPILGVFSLILPISLKIRLNSLMIMALFFLSDLSGGIDQITGQSDSMVGHWAHLGGMVSGMLIAAYLKLGEDAVEERHLEIGVKASQASIGYGVGERSLQIALERNPDNVEALLALARIKTKFHNGPEGKELYEKAIPLMLASQSTELVDVFREYFGKYRTVPADPPLVWRLAEVLRTASEVELCIDCLEYLVKAESVAPQVREKALFQLATLLEYTGRFEISRSYFARFAAEFPATLLAETAREKAGDVVYTPPAPPTERIEATRVQLCPTCGCTMASRPATSGPHQGKLFWVCGQYPACRTALAVQEAPQTAHHRPARPQPVPERYQVMLEGTLPFSCDQEETKENLARLFRSSRERVDSLLCGKATVLKKGLDYATAQRLKEAIDATGALGAVVAEKPAAAAPSFPAPQHMEGVPGAQPASAPAAQAGQGRQAQTAPSHPAQPVQGSGHQLPTPARRIVCPKCGVEQEKSECCEKCGVYFAKLAGAAEREFHAFRDQVPGARGKRGISEAQEKQWAMWCHLLAFSGFLIPFGNFLGPLAVWLLKRRESEFVDFHGKTALNYQITMLIVGVGATLLAVLSGFFTLVILPLVGILTIYTLVTIINCAIKSSRGEWVEIGLSGEFIK